MIFFLSENCHIIQTYFFSLTHAFFELNSVAVSSEVLCQS